MRKERKSGRADVGARCPCPYLIALFVFISLLSVSNASAYELSGYISAEGRVFFNDPLFPDQKRDNVSLAVKPELYYEWESGSNFTFTPFARLDSADPERSHFDIRELNYLRLHDEWELRVGIGKIFWGVTEFVHLIDIINQTDAVESIDGEDKLGQPMIHLSVPRDWGVLEAFVLPYFRERTFPGKNGRFRAPFIVDTDRVVYESSAEENNIDIAVRYSNTIGDWDFGIYYFKGTGREPTLLLSADSSGNPIFIPYYEQIDQTGLDVQAVLGSWLLKLEGLYRKGQREGFYASVGGFEYAFINMASSGMDLDLIIEWAYDDRGKESTTGYDNDLMGGMRLAFNDAASTDALIGIIQDLDSDGSSFAFESSRRIGDNWKVSLDAFIVIDTSEEDAIHSLRDDDSVSIELAHYF
ncbi:MAG: hypothetical protein ISR97_03890 [Nitrospira sp.]|nr:hypothetical protein [Nitrospira sp.]